MQNKPEIAKWQQQQQQPSSNLFCVFLTSHCIFVESMNERKQFSWNLKDENEKMKWQGKTKEKVDRREMENGCWE
jgi:hypothetical protein